MISRWDMIHIEPIQRDVCEISEGKWRNMEPVSKLMLCLRVSRTWQYVSFRARYLYLSWCYRLWHAYGEYLLINFSFVKYVGLKIFNIGRKLHVYRRSLIRRTWRTCNSNEIRWRNLLIDDMHGGSNQKRYYDNQSGDMLRERGRENCACEHFRWDY